MSLSGIVAGVVLAVAAAHQPEECDVLAEAIPKRSNAMVQRAQRHATRRGTGEPIICAGQCGIGEGDCDRDADCLPGLRCDFDWWWGTDYCAAGPDTTDYSWSEWAAWGDCTVSCGRGFKGRQRICIPPSNGGAACPSAMQGETVACKLRPCPVDGAWGEWGDYGECSATCGGGERERVRFCDNPAPLFGGLQCEGVSAEKEQCNREPCPSLSPPVDGGWGNWSDFGGCNASCGGGIRKKVRVCDNPAPLHGGKPCEGASTEEEKCNEEPCSSPVDGGWGEWSDYGACSVECGGGTRKRVRSCDDPAPLLGGKHCSGRSTQELRCNQQPCPADYAEVGVDSGVAARRLARVGPEQADRGGHQ